MTQRDVVFPPGRQALYDRNRYSPAIRANGLLFVSGQVGSRDDGSPKPELKAQVQRACENLNAVLQAAIARLMMSLTSRFSRLTLNQMLKPSWAY